MLYYFIRPFAKLTFQMLYRNVRFSGMEHIPKGVPIIFATNHPSAFLEPCLMATWLPRSLSFIVRGDLFKTKFKRLLLASMHLVPMFRVKDGGLNALDLDSASNSDDFDMSHVAYKYSEKFGS